MTTAWFSYQSLNTVNKMKNIIFTIIVVVFSMVANNVMADGFTKDSKGNYTQVSTRKTSESKDVATTRTYTDSNGKVHPVVEHTYTRGEKAGQTWYCAKITPASGKSYLKPLERK